MYLLMMSLLLCRQRGEGVRKLAKSCRRHLWTAPYGISLPIFLIHAPKLRVAKEQNIRIICRLGKNRNESMWMNGPINNISLVHWLILL